MASHCDRMVVNGVMVHVVEMPLPTFLTRSEIAYTTHPYGPGSVVGIATELQAGRSGDRIPAGSEIFRTCPNRPWTHLAYCTIGTGSFRG